MQQAGGTAGTENKEDFDDLRAGIPVISLTGAAGTGKTLLLLDLAVELSRRRRVLFMHGGPLREGHKVINSRLHKVDFCSGTEGIAASAGLSCEKDLDGADTDSLSVSEAIAANRSKGTLKETVLQALAREKYSFLLVDEANRISSHTLKKLMETASAAKIPCVFCYDPHSILGAIPPMEDAEAVIAGSETMRLELSGNIRINWPIFSFLRTLFHQKDSSGHADCSCIDVLCAPDREQEEILTAHYLSMGYEKLSASSGAFQVGEIIGQEYDKVLMVMDGRFYYDEALCLCSDGSPDAAIPPLYEGLSRAREKLCLIITGNERLFSQVLAIRTKGV